MSWLSDLFRDTLKPTERELLEADAAWWKDCAAHWREQCYALEDERADLIIDKCALRNALLDIRIYTQGQKSGTAQKVHRMASEALKS